MVDGDAEHPEYRYGGVWKNKKGAVSGKKPKGKYNRPKDEEAGKERETIKNEESVDEHVDVTDEEEGLEGLSDQSHNS